MSLESASVKAEDYKFGNKKGLLVLESERSVLTRSSLLQATLAATGDIGTGF